MVGVGCQITTTTTHTLDHLAALMEALTTTEERVALAEVETSDVVLLHLFAAVVEDQTRLPELADIHRLTISLKAFHGS
jgi:hypothetical protein